MGGGVDRVRPAGKRHDRAQPQPIVARRQRQREMGPERAQRARVHGAAGPSLRLGEVAGVAEVVPLLRPLLRTGGCGRVPDE